MLILFASIFLCACRLTNCLCQFTRFWAIPDPVERDKEASSLKKHQSELLHPTVDCDKKASHKYKALLSSTEFGKNSY